MSKLKGILEQFDETTANLNKKDEEELDVATKSVEEVTPEDEEAKVVEETVETTEAEVVEETKEAEKETKEVAEDEETEVVEEEVTETVEKSKKEDKEDKPKGKKSEDDDEDEDDKEDKTKGKKDKKDKKEDKEDKAEKNLSVDDFTGALDVVLKSFQTLAGTQEAENSRVTAVEARLAEIMTSLASISDQLTNQEVVAKSANVAKMITDKADEPEGKAVGFVSKSVELHEDTTKEEVTETVEGEEVAVDPLDAFRADPKLFVNKYVQIARTSAVHPGKLSEMKNLHNRVQNGSPVTDKEIEQYTNFINN